jgi:hypothetical protein
MLVALANFMLLSVTKAAHAAVSGDAWQEIRVRSGWQFCCARKSFSEKYFALQ